MRPQNGQGGAAPRPGISPFAAALLSFLVPGSGQFLLGKRQRGLGFFLTIAILGALTCLALIVQKLVEDAVVFAYAGGLLAVGLVLWLLSSRASRRP